MLRRRRRAAPNLSQVTPPGWRGPALGACPGPAISRCMVVDGGTGPIYRTLRWRPRRRWRRSSTHPSSSPPPPPSRQLRNETDIYSEQKEVEAVVEKEEEKGEEETEEAVVDEFLKRAWGLIWLVLVFRLSGNAGSSPLRLFWRSGMPKAPWRLDPASQLINSRTGAKCFHIALIGREMRLCLLVGSTALEAWLEKQDLWLKQEFSNRNIEWMCG